MPSSSLRRSFAFALFAIAVAPLACERAAPPAKSNAATPPAVTSKPAGTPPAPDVAATPANPKSAQRIIAVGDLHGDLASTREALRVAGIIDANDRWSAGDAIFVQTGDILDRGDDEQAILDLLLRLEGEATKAGGQAVLLHGNHELMNVAGDLRYVTPGGYIDFADVPGLATDHPGLAEVPEHIRPRLAAFLPGGVYARKLAHHAVIAQVGDTLFAHGGVLPEHLTYGIERINAETTAWLQGEAPPPEILQSERSPVWSRHFSTEPTDCALLTQTLEAAGAKRLVVGHTPQLKGVTQACDGKVWRIDTGIADHYGGPSQAIEIQGDTVRVLGAQ